MRLLWWCALTQLVLSQSFEDIFYDILPKRLQQQTVSISSNTKLYANRYTNIKDLVEDLIGDPHYVNSFNFSQPFDYAHNDYEISANKSTDMLSSEIETGLYSKLVEIYHNFQKIYSILGDLNVDDFVAIYDYVYGETAPDEIISSLSVDGEEGYVENLLFKNMFEFNNGFEEPPNDEAILPLVPFVDSKDYVPYPTQNGTDDQLNVGDGAQAQLLLILFKIPLLIIKLILKIVWLLIELKKYIELIEVKIILYIIKIIQKICKIIMRIKKKISKIIKDIKTLVLPYLILKKIKAIILLILKKLRILCWELQDILYRYKWKTLFLIKHAEKKFLLYAIFFKECIYGKLDKPEKKDKMLEDFVNYDDDYYDWDDYDYFKEFSHYIYRPSYKTKDQEIKKVIDRMEEADESEDFDDDYDEIDDEEFEYHGDDLPFDLKEEFGFDTVRLNIGNDKVKIMQVPKKKKLY